MTPDHPPAPSLSLAPPNVSLPNFDPVAHIYRFAEYLALGPLLQRTRTHFLPQLPPRSHALLLGDGDGRFLAQLLATQPNLHALAIDTSAAMLHLLRRRCQPHAHRLQTLQTSALDLFQPSGEMRETRCEMRMQTHDDHRAHESIGFAAEYESSPRISSPASRILPLSPRISPLASRISSPDLITTHFFLDCLTQPQLDTLALQLAAHTARGTLWLLSDFAIPAAPFLRPLAALYIRALYLAFRILTGLRVTHLPNPQTALAAAGFDRIARHDLLGGLLYTEIWQRR